MMTTLSYNNLALDDFEHARRKAFWRNWMSRMTGKKNRLLSASHIPSGLPNYLGLRSVPLDKILGSEGRSKEFDQHFYPRRASTKDRWVRVDMAHYEDVYLPPIELLKIGNMYFVRDGNHRVSVARMRGQQYVDAFVTEIQTKKETNNEKFNVNCL